MKVLTVPIGISSYTFYVNKYFKVPSDLSAGGHRMSPNLGRSLVGPRPWSSDDKMWILKNSTSLLIPLWLVLVLQYLTNALFMVLRSLVRRHKRSFLVNLLEPAINLCLYGDLCNFGVQYRYGRF